MYVAAVRLDLIVPTCLIENGEALLSLLHGTRHSRLKN